jgi:1-aminocyclopropane-1-carboxylate deaminase/D-cysteine desulfhydrase-like pyridoxal-dependent ACC family enzyme
MITISEEVERKWRTYSQPPVQPILFGNHSPACSILRLDLIKSWASGNKYFKLKYVLHDALEQGIPTIVSKGGMFSNHLAALAEACSVFGIQLVAVIRTYGPDDLNPSIRRLKQLGVQILYLTPGEYKAFDQQEAEKLFSGAMFIPEGGLSVHGIRGASEIVQSCIPHAPTHVIISGGTMGTACGLLMAMPSSIKVIIVPAWKGCTEEYVSGILNEYEIEPSCSWELWPDFHFEGFGKFNEELISFMTLFTSNTRIPLDPVYTGKMMYGIHQKIEEGYFKETDQILAIHTGGLQGIEGFKYRYPEKWNG